MWVPTIPRRGRVLAAAALSWTMTACADQMVAPQTRDARPTRDLTSADSATRGPTRQWTVMVYMAADNSLAVQGVGDIDEMEAAGATPGVQVVVQGEFNQGEFSRAGCPTASCAHLPSFDTFRYAIGETPGAKSVTGPDGDVTTIGNRNMTDPNELADFVRWAKDKYPAQHYALVLWNHGGGYSGLLEDLGSAGSRLMSIADLPTALGGVGQLDVLDFDMCLMAGYETLVQVAPFAQYVVFSEETEPGEGDPYTGMLSALNAAPQSDGRAVAGMFVDEWAKFYEKHRASTTKSAYDMRGFAAFEAALDDVAGRLTTALGDEAGSAAVRDAASHAQRFEIRQLADLGTVVDALRANAADGSATAGALGALRETLASPSFLVRNTARTGDASNARDVSRASGLNVLLPSGSAGDALPDGGPLSFGEYQKLLPDRAWTKFLAAYLGAGAPTTAAYDQGESRFESYVLWDQAATQKGADVDMWILEPDGNLYIPFLGTVSPNGHLTPDSYDDGVSYEGYLTNRYVVRGRYQIYANLFADPADARPRFDVEYRFGQDAEFKSLYAPDYPRLSLQQSWLDDAEPTLDKIEAGAYSDLQLAAYADLGANGSSMKLAPALKAAPAPAMRLSAGPVPRVTPQQLLAVRTHSAERAAARAMRVRVPGATPRTWVRGLKPILP